MTTPAIQARHALGRAQSADYIDWAMDAILEGLDSPNLRILAGLDRFVSPFEAEEHFKKARKELGIAVPSRDEAIRDYAIYLATAILEPDTDYETLVSKLSELCYSNDYPAFLMDWYSLDDGLSDIRSGHYPFGFEELYGSDPREIVIRVAKAFLNKNSEQNEGGNSE